MNQARTIYIEDVSGSRLLWCRIIESENAQRRTKVFESISNRFARINRSHFRAQFVRVHCALCIHRERERAAFYSTNWHSFSHTMQTSYLHPQFQSNIFANVRTQIALLLHSLDAHNEWLCTKFSGGIISLWQFSVFEKTWRGWNKSTQVCYPERNTNFARWL